MGGGVESTYVVSLNLLNIAGTRILIVEMEDILKDLRAAN